MTLLLAGSLPAAANHAQTDGGRITVFDHVAGNQWWVEVALSGQDAGSVASVEAQDTNGAWTMLAKKSWGPYAASFHIEPGNQVRFRATWAGGAQSVSCWFTHPAGLEQCGTQPVPTTFDATFTGVRGNEWWVQAQVATNGPAIVSVDVRLYNGVWSDWKPVAKQSWGWGSSYHIFQGTILQLRATSTAGQVETSSCRQWTPPSNQDATIVACPGASPPAFDATFTGVKGNEWWVQASVAGNEPIAAVHFRVNCAPQWLPLTKQSWGGWAPTYQVHFEQGDKVDFKATSADGDSDASGGYVWRAATPTSGCALGTWPVIGSHVVYNLDSSVCGGGECFDAAATLTLTYEGNSGWDGVCVGRNTRTATDGTQTHEDWVGGALDIIPLFTKVPSYVDASHGLRQLGVFYSAKSCGITGVDTLYTVDRQEMRQTAMVDANHNPVTLNVWVADREMPEEPFLESIWDTKLGMVVESHSYPRRSGHGDSNLYVTLTDAPLR